MKGKVKIILSLCSLLVVVTFAVIAVLALSNTTTASNFEVSFTGKRDVFATINGSSYVSSSPDTAIESIDQITFNGGSSEQEISSPFTRPVTIVSYSDTADFVFTIQNTSTDTNFNKLIIEPEVIIDVAENVVYTVYNYVEGTYIEVTEDEYLIIEKGESCKVKISYKYEGESETDVSISGNMSFNLYSEKEELDMVSATLVFPDETRKVYYKGSSYLKADIEVPNIIGKTFVGWYTDASYSNEASSNLTGKVTLYAKYDNIV